MSQINVIDLFAGPGGLGEGFSAYTSTAEEGDPNEHVFKIRLSVEMDKHAHQTLMLRSFVRQFEDCIPSQYYDFYRGELTFEELKELPEFEAEWEAAKEEVGGGPLCMGDEREDGIIQGKLAGLLKKANADEKWVVIGGPPCQAFSSVGRVRNMAKPDYRQSEDKRIYAYIEYLKILDQVQPDCFVLENVAGMLQTAPDGELIFPTILEQLGHPSKALKEMGIQPTQGFGARKPREYKIIPASDEGVRATAGSEYLVPIVDYGVPQDRRRVILVGVSTGIVDGMDKSVRPRLKRYADNGVSRKVSVGEVIGDLPKIRSKISTRNFFGSEPEVTVTDIFGLSPKKVTIITEGSKKGLQYQTVPKNIAYRRLSAIDWYINGLLADNAKKLEGLRPSTHARPVCPMEKPSDISLPEPVKAAARISKEYRENCISLWCLRELGKMPRDSDELWKRLQQHNWWLVSQLSSREVSMKNESMGVVSDGGFLEASGQFNGPKFLADWLLNVPDGGVRNHECREYKGSDLLRYLYFTINSRGETDESINLSLRDVPPVLQPDHANASSGHFSDRFRVQAHDKPAKTITCHLGKDGHAFIHYDPAQCRALSVREAARIQTFPDNYVFCGPVSEQRKQVGNAVPPWFAFQLAGLVEQLLNLESKKL